MAFYPIDGNYTINTLIRKILSNDTHLMAAVPVRHNFTIQI